MDSRHWGGRNLRLKLGKNQLFSLVFFSPIGHLFPLFLYSASAAIFVTSHTLDFPALQRTPPAPFLLRPDKPPSSFSLVSPRWWSLHDFASNGQTIDMVAGLNRRPCGLCVQPISSQPRWLDQVQPNLKKEKRKAVGPSNYQT